MSGPSTSAALSWLLSRGLPGPQSGVDRYGIARYEFGFGHIKIVEVKPIALAVITAALSPSEGSCE